MQDYPITTPEQVRFSHPVAGLASRAMAWCLDQFIIFVVLIAIVWASFYLDAAIGLITFFIVKFTLDFGYFTWFELRGGGRTPGKRALGIRVVSATGGRLRFADILLRTLLRAIDGLAMIPFLPIPGGIVAWLDPYHRRLGDFVAETIVIRDVKAELPMGVLKEQTRINTFQLDPAIRGRILARTTREERRIMLDLMLRRDQLDPDSRENLFAEAADRFKRRYALPQDNVEHLSDEQIVLNLALVTQSTDYTG